MEADGTGHYADFVRELMAEAGYHNRLIIPPIQRALRDFVTEPEACLIPVSKRSLQVQIPDLDPATLIQGRPIDYISGHFVTLPGQEMITDPRKQLAGKAIASWRGINVAMVFPSANFTILQTESEFNAIRMLQTGRVQAIWGWIPDSYILFEQLGIGEPVIAVDKPIFSSSAHIVCKKTRRGTAFLSALDKTMDVMRSNGHMKQILGKHTRVIGVDVPMSVAEPNW